MSTLAPEVSAANRSDPAREIPEYSVHLDAIRGGAACVVFLTHLRYLLIASARDKKPGPPVSMTEIVPPRSGRTAPNTGEVHRDFGHQAVIVFFVLSGFLVGGSVVRALKSQRWNWKKYLVHRMVRLWIVLIPALVLGLCLDLAGTRHFAGQGAIYSAPHGQGMIQRNILDRLDASTFFGNLFFLQDVKVQPLGTNVPLWSLTNEFWYYLAFPLLCLVFVRHGAVWKRALAGIVMAGILFFVGHKIAEYFLIWLLGVAAAFTPLRIPARLQRGIALAMLLLFLVVNAAIRYHEPHVFHTDVIVALLFFLLLYSVLHLRTPFRRGVYRSGAGFMSKISYSLYLTHVPVLCLASAIVARPWYRLPVNGETAAILFAIVVSVFAVACAVHLLFEARTDVVRRWLEARLD